MPKIKTINVSYTVGNNEHKVDVNVMYDTGRRIFYVVPPESFKEAIRTMPDEMKATYHIDNAMGLRGVYGFVMAHASEIEVTDNLRYLFHYCGNATKIERNVILVWCKGDSSIEDKTWSRRLGNKESKEIKQAFRFTLAIETTTGVGEPVYTYQNETASNTITVKGYHETAVVIDDTPQNRQFLEDIYNKLDTLIINLERFFASSESVLELIQSNQRLLN